MVPCARAVCTGRKIVLSFVSRLIPRTKLHEIFEHSHPEYDHRKDGCLHKLVDHYLDRRRGRQGVRSRWQCSIQRNVEELP